MKNILICIISFATLFSCKSPAPEESDAAQETNVIQLTPAQYKNSNLTIGHLEQKSISNTLKLNGVIDVPPQNMISVSVPLGGYLKMTKLLPGMPVQKGETIVIIEDQQYIQLQQDYLSAKARLTFAEKEFARQSELNQSKAGSDKVFQQAQADFTSLKVQVRSLSEKLQLIGISPVNLNEDNISRSVNLVSPIKGYVAKVNFNIGKYINSTDVLFELVNHSDIHLMLTVFEKELDKLHVGQKLAAYTNTNPDRKYPCEIILLGKTFAADKSVQVHCHFEKYDLSLIPGMFMNADVKVKSKNALVLPADAVMNYENKFYIFKKTGDMKFEMTEVKTGNTEDGYVEILSDVLTVNDQIVTKGAYNLLMSMKNKEE